jgi:superfamily I DNA/RNA helicase
MPFLEFAGTQQIILGENYRSTGAILRASLEIISRGTPVPILGSEPVRFILLDDTRIDRSLFTSHGRGTTPTLCECDDEWREADMIADEVKRLLAYGGGQLTYNDFAILCELCCGISRCPLIHFFFFKQYGSMPSRFISKLRSGDRAFHAEYSVVTDSSSESRSAN